MSKQIWTDGACFPNPGKGGWAWHRCDGASAFGGERETTNNRMELTAILQARRALGDGEVAVVHSDSSYCVNGLTIWSAKWARMNWIKKTGPNRDLWIDLAHEVRRVRATIKWVRGHNGDPGNERADELAGQGRASIL